MLQICGTKMREKHKTDKKSPVEKNKVAKS